MIVRGTDIAQPSRDGWLAGLFAPFESLWRNRSLVRRITRREIEARYRGTAFGLLWSVLTPLLMLGVYSFLFTVVFTPRWELPSGSPGNFVLVFFSGLTVFNLFAEAVNRAPVLVLENVSYVKKVVFPLETLAWISLLGAMVNAGVSGALLLLLYVAMAGVPPATALLVPLALLPLLFFILGISWFLASIGVFLRDIRLVIGVVTNAFLFLSPIFYPLSAVPQGLRPVMMLNPLTLAVEHVRTLLFVGTLPSLVEWAIFLAAGMVVCCLGFAWFAKTKKGFADVL